MKRKSRYPVIILPLSFFIYSSFYNLVVFDEKKVYICIMGKKFLN